MKGLIGRAQEEARKKLLHSIIDSEARARCRRLDRMLICSGTDCISGSSKSTKYWRSNSGSRTTRNSQLCGFHSYCWEYGHSNTYHSYCTHCIFRLSIDQKNSELWWWRRWWWRRFLTCFLSNNPKELNVTPPQPEPSTVLQPHYESSLPSTSHL